jgi:5-methylcytosine-specific restriction endonuclease McrA
MQGYSLTHLPDHELLRDLAALVARDRSTTAALLAHLAEVDERRLHLPAAYPSLHAYCVGELHMSADAAAKRIHAARAARRFPALLAAVADGRLHLSAVVLLAPHLSPGNAGDLIVAATHRTKDAIEQMLASRFPRPDVPMILAAVAPASAGSQHAPGHVGSDISQQVAGLLVADEAQHAPQHVGVGEPRAKLAPLSPGRYALQVTVSQATHDKLRYAQALLGHAVPTGDVAQVLDPALDALVAQLERRRFAQSSRSRPRRSRARGSNADSRRVPAGVRREVWQRDGGQCTYVSEQGHRCESRTHLEFDHAEPFARGGATTMANLRLRCRAHNQYAAEQAFGSAFMEGRREAARAARAAARKSTEAAAVRAAQGRERAARKSTREVAEEVVPYLRSLGVRPPLARELAAAAAEALPAASLEDRIRHAVRTLAPRGTRREFPTANAPPLA